MNPGYDPLEINDRVEVTGGRYCSKTGQKTYGTVIRNPTPHKVRIVFDNPPEGKQDIEVNRTSIRLANAAAPPRQGNLAPDHLLARPRTPVPVPRQIDLTAEEPSDDSTTDANQDDSDDDDYQDTGADPDDDNGSFETQAPARAVTRVMDLDHVAEPPIAPKRTPEEVEREEAENLLKETLKRNTATLARKRLKTESPRGAGTARKHIMHGEEPPVNTKVADTARIANAEKGGKTPRHEFSDASSDDEKQPAQPTTAARRDAAKYNAALYSMYHPGTRLTAAANIPDHMLGVAEVVTNVIERQMGNVLQAHVGITQAHSAMMHQEHRRSTENLIRDEHSRLLVATSAQIARSLERSAERSSSHQVTYPKCPMELHYHHLCVARILAKTDGDVEATCDEIRKFVAKYKSEDSPFFDH